MRPLLGRETEPRDHSLLTELNIQETHKCTDTYRIAICVCHVLEFKAIILRGPQRDTTLEFGWTFGSTCTGISLISALGCLL